MTSVGRQGRGGFDILCVRPAIRFHVTEHPQLFDAETAGKSSEQKTTFTYVFSSYSVVVFVSSHRFIV